MPEKRGLPKRTTRPTARKTSRTTAPRKSSVAKRTAAASEAIAKGTLPVAAPVTVDTCPRCGTTKFAPEERIRAEGRRTVRYTVLVCERGHTFAKPVRRAV